MAFVDLGFEEIVKLAEFINFFESASKSIHKLNQKWWVEPLTGAPKFNHGEKFMLMVSEISEAMEGQRQGKMDDKLPHRPMVEVELADAIIRILDYSGKFNLDIGGAIYEKLLYNTTRKDHTIEARLKPGGKKF
jgi:hypothetical protein